MSDAVENAVKGKILTYGTLATNGGSIVLLVTALQVLGQHGEELNFLRGEIQDLRLEITANQVDRERHRTEVEAMGLQFDRDIKELSLRMDALDRMASDPHARPDAWTRTDDDERTKEIKDWVKLYFNANIKNGTQTSN